MLITFGCRTYVAKFGDALLEQFELVVVLYPGELVGSAILN